MATQWKLTIHQGQTSEQVVQASGTTISGGNGIEVNIDQNGMTQRECVNALGEIIKKILESPYPAA
ncbi:hypothetical protein HZY97_16235 [Sphingomonas sp. R-74633]|uniref:hypothetical protein n=1 Tax=Sphingomonas sp. R-74633 TaxID=2751188 RepID=UPI0015D18967|nr:hypothetical protein [Sphingomonas sp. R-74633]NYT42322.1 hypothetical protein [Sphingomonas sp. R-74633]